MIDRAPVSQPGSELPTRQSRVPDETKKVGEHTSAATGREGTGSSAAQWVSVNALRSGGPEERKMPLQRLQR
jgi:hypothetical protein